jgi:hypothetical protein
LMINHGTDSWGGFSALVRTASDCTQGWEWWSRRRAAQLHAQTPQGPGRMRARRRAPCPCTVAAGDELSLDNCTREKLVRKFVPQKKMLAAFVHFFHTSRQTRGIKVVALSHGTGGGARLLWPRARIFREGCEQEERKKWGGAQELSLRWPRSQGLESRAFSLSSEKRTVSNLNLVTVVSPPILPTIVI